MADVKSGIFDLGLCAALLAGMLTTAPAAAGKADPRLEIATYNVQFVMPDLPIPGNLVRDLPGQKPNVELRARAIGAALACFDVIALQETINDRRRGRAARSAGSRRPRLRQAVEAALGADVRDRCRTRPAARFLPAALG
jgi:hypothetical protein